MSYANTQGHVIDIVDTEDDSNQAWSTKYWEGSQRRHTTEDCRADTVVVIPSKLTSNYKNLDYSSCRLRNMLGLFGGQMENTVYHAWIQAESTYQGVGYTTTAANVPWGDSNPTVGPTWTIRNG